MDILIIILLLVILAEVTFLLLKQNPRGLQGRRSGRPIFVDTSVLIDGRIVAIAESGFLSDRLMIPRSVIGELQFLADNGDSEKRSRARHGLDVVSELQALKDVEVEIFPDGSRAEEGVDERLLKLAKQHGGALCTIDYNLNKVAQVEQITVVNVNDLAMSLRMAHLPGEVVRLALTTKGNDHSQAVGHLEDGTMVVVEQAKSKIGSAVEVEIIRSLQTSAGRMMFARLAGEAKQVKQPKVADSVRQKKPSQKPAVSRPESKRASEGQKKSQVATKPTATKAPARRPAKRRKNNEDRLIELVNNQD